MKTKMQTITPNQITESLTNAKTLCTLAYAPHPTSSGALLCWSGRIARAVQMGNAAYSDKPKKDAIRQAIDTLCTERNKAENAAHKAASDYTALCIAAGVEPAKTQDIYPPACNCEGCQIGQAQDKARDSLYAMRAAVYALLTPTEDGKPLPVLLELVEAVGDESKRKQLWHMVENIARAQRKYIDALATLDEKPDWARVLR